MLVGKWRAWRERRAEKAARREFQRGYDYAKKSLEEGSESPLCLQCFVDMSKMFHDYSNFDRGIEVAIATAIADGLVVDDRNKY
jgi:hypothetical protein